jgi:hypothetical protein
MRNSNPNQLPLDFSIPAVKSLTVRDIAKALSVSTGKIYAAIDCGRLTAVAINHDDADRAEWRVPLHNYVAWLNNEYSTALLWRYPATEWLTSSRLAAFLNCSVQHIHNLVEAGEFPNSENIGLPGRQKRLRIPLQDLVAFVNRRKSGGNAC